MKDRIGLGHVILLVYALFSAFAFTFVPIFFRKQGFSLYQLTLIYLLFYGLAAVSVSVISTYNLKWSIFAGLLCYMFVGVGLAIFPARYSLFLYAIFSSFAIALFWVPLNYLFFEKSSNNKNATNSSVYFIVGGLFGIIIPPLGVLIIEKFGYTILFMVTAIGFLIAAVTLFKFIPKKKFDFSLLYSLKNFKGLKTITLITGALHSFNIAVIPIYTLLFLKTELSFGLFTSYLAVVGLVIALILSHFSDKQQKRKRYIYSVFVLMGLSIFSLSLAKNLFQWLIVVGIYLVLSTISSPLRLAISMDVKKTDLGFWKARELLLNVGRVVMLLFAITFFYLELYWLIFASFGMITLAYPLLVKKKLEMLK